MKKQLKECYEELERIARIICERKIGQCDVKFLRSAMQGTLTEISKQKDKERNDAEARKLERLSKKYNPGGNQ